jgi:hypothetical protein
LRTFTDILADIREFRPLDRDWLPLDGLVGELWQTGHASDAVEELIAVFERFPEEDGAGVFWSILHGLESLPGYEVPFVQSVQRCPSEFGVMMLGRKLNAGEAEADGVPLLPLLQSVALRDDASERSQHLAAKFVGKHLGRS